MSAKVRGFPGAGVTNSSELPVPEIELKASASAGYPLNHRAIFPDPQVLFLIHLSIFNEFQWVIQEKN